MSVKVASLWKDSQFRGYNNETKLLYIYLVTNRDLNVVGVFSPSPEVICSELNFTIEGLREFCKTLVVDKRLYLKKYEGVVYWVIPKHFNTVPKSQSSVTKVQKALSELPDVIVNFLETVGISSKQKIRPFERPTPEQVSEYAIKLGYLIDGNEFVRYYEDQSYKYGKKHIWVDGRGTEVRDWKAKLKRVWCKDDNKLKIFKEAPKGFKSFYIIQDGKPICPDGWRNGKPFSKEFTVDIEMKKEFDSINL